jgi:acetyltransferase-like isoleucine patch superfamily enzyme
VSQTSEEGSARTTLLDSLEEEGSSAVDKYRELYVGESSLAALLRYELLTFFLAPCPGTLGMVLRKALYRSLFLAMGRGTIFAPYVTLRCPRRISLGERNFIDAQAVLDAKGERSGIVTGDLVLIGHSSVLSCSDATITIGSDVSIGAQCTIRAGLGPITIGSSVTIGSQSVVISGNPDYKRLDVPMKRQLGSGKGVEIGDDVWIGVGARIIDGVTIGSGSVVGAGAVVIRDLPDYSIAAGVPAEVMGTRRE